MTVMEKGPATRPAVHDSAVAIVRARPRSPSATISSMVRPSGENTASPCAERIAARNRS